MDLPKRKNVRLKYYDYSIPGYYFITICTRDRQHLLWENDVGATFGRPSLSKIGELVDREVNKISTIYEHIIRKDTELQEIREYIRNNPTQWHMDKYFK